MLLKSFRRFLIQYDPFLRPPAISDNLVKPIQPPEIEPVLDPSLAPTAESIQ